jgi:hypothetical protein
MTNHLLHILLKMNIKKLFLIIVLFSSCISGQSQSISTENLKSIKLIEDSLKTQLIKLTGSAGIKERFTADSILTKMLVRSLKIKNSFYHPFDSLKGVSRLYAPDSSFRIFTWQIFVSDYITRQRGAIQMKTTDGSLKLFPLIDKSDVADKMEDTVGNNLGWMGAVYYKLLLNKYQNENFYTLIGYDANNIRSAKKIIEVVHFDNNEPVFGGPFFICNECDNKNPSRYIMEYKKEASARLNYDEELRMIVMEHLISENNEPQKKWTLIGDGDYDAFKWESGKWVFVNKIFNMVTPEGAPPIPSTIRDEKGTIDENKLNSNRP